MTAPWVDFIIDAPLPAALALKMTLLLAAAWVAHAALWRANPRWRVLLWRGVALALLALPGVALLAPALRVVVAPAPQALDLANVVLPPVLARPVRPAPALEALPAAAPVQPAPPPAEPWRVDWPLAGAAAWGFGVLLLGLRHALAQRSMRRVIRNARPAPEAVQRIFDSVALELGVTQVRLAITEAVSSPLLFGVRRPVALLPEKMCGERFAADLPAIFAHELGHAAARDLAWLGLVRLVQTLFWPHPLAWGMRAACAAAVERVTDAVAAGALADPERYSRSLARVALALAGRPVGQPALAMAIPDIRRRLLTLKQGRAARPLRRAAVRLALAGAVLLVAALGALKPVAAEGPVNIPNRIYEVKNVPTKYIYFLSPTQLEEVRSLNAAGRLRDAVWGQTTPSATGREIVLDETQRALVVRGANQEQIDRFIRAVPSLKRAKGQMTAQIYMSNDRPFGQVDRMLAIQLPAAREYKRMTTQTYRIRESDTPRLKARLGQIDAATPGLLKDREHKILIDKEDLIFVDTPENIFKLVPRLREDKLLVQEASRPRDTNSFPLMKLAGNKLTVEQINALGKRAVETMKATLYAEGGENAARKAGRWISYDAKTMSVQVQDWPEGTAYVGHYLGSLPELQSVENHIYKIKEEDGPRIKALIDSAIRSTNHKPLDLERKIFIDKDDLIVRDTPDNIKKIEELLLDKKFINDMTNQKLDIANFSLAPRDTQAPAEQVRAVSTRVLEEIKTFLYEKEGEAKAMTEGRRLWFDPGTLQLMIVDTLDRLARVREYLGSVPELAYGNEVRQEAVTLHYLAPKEMIRRLQEASARIAWNEQNGVFTLRQGEERKWKNMRIRLLRVRDPAGNPRQNEGQAQFTVDNGYQTEQRNMQELSTEYVDDYRMTVEDVQAEPGDTGAGSARFRLTWVPKRMILPPLEGISLVPFEGPQGRGIIIRYQVRDRARSKDILNLVRQLDVKPEAPAAGSSATTVPMEALPAPAAPASVALPKPDSRTRQEVIFLTYAVADELAYDLLNRISPAGEKRELEMTLEPHHSRHLGDIYVNLRSLDAGKAGDARDGSAELILTGDGPPRTLRLTPGEACTVRDLKITAMSITTGAKESENTLRFSVAFTTQPVPGKALAKPLEGITIRPFGERNALIINYTNPESFQLLVPTIKALDKPDQRISLETMILDVTDPALDLVRELETNAVDGQAGADKAHLAASRIPSLAYTDKIVNKLAALEKAGRLKRVAGPKISSLDNHEAVFRMELVKPSGKMDAAVVRIKPIVNPNGNRIRLKDFQMELFRDMEPPRPDSAPGGQAGKPNASRAFDLEVSNGQSVLLTGPDFGGRVMLIGAYLVE